MILKSRMTTVASLGLASLILVAGPATAGGNGSGHGRNHAVYDYAKVLNVEPVVRYVTVSTPVKECWEEMETYATRSNPPGTAGRTLFGAIVGGVIGHQFGSGRGNDAATVAGALMGAAVGHDAGRRNADYHTTRYSRPVRRCETNYQTHEEERIDGYKVLYTYNGRKYSTRTPFDPGNRLRIRVDVRPAP
jgi:uncharacterized protein YcfJ